MIISVLLTLSNMSRAQNREKKLAVLKIIKKNKDILFAPFRKHSINKMEKEAAWQEVLEKAQSLGLASSNRDWTYARDHIFGLWKSRTLAKRDNARRIELLGGQPSLIYDAVDERILGILESEPATVNESPPSIQESDGVGSNIESQNSDTKPQLSTHKTATAQRKQLNGDNCSDIERLKIAVLESELYKNKLQILALERSMGLKRSKFTENLEDV